MFQTTNQTQVCPATKPQLQPVKARHIQEIWHPVCACRITQLLQINNPTNTNKYSYRISLTFCLQPPISYICGDVITNGQNGSSGKPHLGITRSKLENPVFPHHHKDIQVVITKSRLLVNNLRFPPKQLRWYIYIYANENAKHLAITVSIQQVLLGQRNNFSRHNELFEVRGTTRCRENHISNAREQRFVNTHLGAIKSQHGPSSHPMTLLIPLFESQNFFEDH